ncbi:MAG TPA: trypsin-like peptidase domain-containing protein [Candidatus Limnocylindria bacterium]|nr:trypsin-like peptidase domain-containing protein [Candidatus Limnocylindria bacterium]
MAALADLGREIGEIAEKVGPSVVGIGNRWRGGSGVIIGDNRILTNAHNLHGDEVTVTFADGRTADATVAGVDADGDLAVLSAPTEGATALDLGTDAPGVGTPVVALGNPNGHGPRVTFGFVSGTGRSFRGPRGRRVAGAVEHTAPLMPGSSGGPVVDLEGRLLGVNTNRLGNGFYLAIAADASLRDRVAALGRGEEPKRRRLGVGLAPSHVARRLRRAVGLPERDGLLVREVEDDSPAAKAGIAEGDLIVAVGGREIASADDLFDALGGEGELRITIVRGADEQTLTVAE